MLEKNTEIGPAYFALGPADRQMRLMMQLPLDGTTAAGLRDAVGRFVDTVEETAPLWGGKAQPADPALAPTPVVDPPAFQFSSLIAPGPVDDESLGATLRRLGYAPDVGAIPGRTEYLVTVKRPDCTVQVAAFVNHGRKLLCLGSQMGKAVDMESPAAAAGMERLLRKNAEIGPAYFAFRPEDRHVWLLMQVPLEAATPARVADAVAQFVDTAIETMPLWGEENWQPVEPAAVPD
jgi:hypothetical protein